MNEQKTSLSIPVAIVIAGALIGFGLYWSGHTKAAPAVATGSDVQKESLDSIAPVQPTDYVLGNRNAPVMIVEYSDLECPYCKQYHSTLHQLVTAYGGKVAWTFRHFPVHQNSVPEGEALECVGEIGGNDAFWKYADKVFSETTSNNGLDLAKLPVFASELGIDSAKFSTCVAGTEYEDKINQDRQDVMDAGARGTPYSVIFAGNDKIPLTQGALPFEAMKNIIDTVLKNS
ncbi:MAG TPA: DsbA family protein [Candidatus Paceibacterota bacterium]|nr:DsbA family protein [Candidatus Paceibacterota bacterium]